MKRLLFILLLLATVARLQAQNCMADFQDIDSMFISLFHNDWNAYRKGLVTYDVSYTCKNFKQGTDYDGFMIKDGRQIKKICKQINKLKRNDAEFVFADCKIHIYSADTIVSSACVNGTHTLIDGFCYNTTPSLIRTIERCIRGKERRIFTTHKLVRDSMVAGNDSLSAYVSELCKKLTTKNRECDSLRIRLYCVADKDGNVVEVKFLHYPLESALPQRTKDELIDLFINIIKFNPDKERNKLDKIPINIVLSF